MESDNHIEKTYCLYASDWHLTIMLLPFINKNLDENSKIYMKFENSIEDKVRLLTNKMEIKNKDEIKEMKWNAEISDEDYSRNKKIYIVSGSNEYITEMNRKIEQYYGKRNDEVKIINCLDVLENRKAIKKFKYNNILTTKGETAIN
ncbi:MAG: hypothetical protein IJH12_01290 [Clostridia bacterium]|nr:hypothetical protein [Clostridia bacterium]